MVGTGADKRRRSSIGTGARLVQVQPGKTKLGAKEPEADSEVGAASLQVEGRPASPVGLEPVEGAH